MYTVTVSQKDFIWYTTFFKDGVLVEAYSNITISL